MEPVDFLPDPVKVMWSYTTFLKQRQIDALEPLISEGTRTFDQFIQRYWTFEAVYGMSSTIL